MRKLLGVVFAIVSGCSSYDSGYDAGPCCRNVARIFAVDSAGNPLTISTVTENVIGTQGSCALEFLPKPLPSTVTSNCRRFGVEIVSTDGKRFSGVLDVSQGNNTGPVCSPACKTRELTVPLE
jgi:hypothetical protein